jgi:hypothetical protein
MVAAVVALFRGGVKSEMQETSRRGVPPEIEPHPRINRPLFEQGPLRNQVNDIFLSCQPA